eukprot:TRINITY_DN53407_c0_g1_i1.p1 TRINITY_DN53407_c0_g1~~TRINITY_DN53407_c0_g1_i1.p1  ORF type:complete len:173 (+),score=15.79 TRINITY_DN53407_c0_g1_i1:64-582(+)
MDCAGVKHGEFCTIKRYQVPQCDDGVKTRHQMRRHCKKKPPRGVRIAMQNDIDEMVARASRELLELTQEWSGERYGRFTQRLERDVVAWAWHSTNARTMLREKGLWNDAHFVPLVPVTEPIIDTFVVVKDTLVCPVRARSDAVRRWRSAPPPILKALELERASAECVAACQQ